MKYILPIIAALFVLPAIPQDTLARESEKSFSNNTGQAAYMFMRSMPDGMRENFNKKMQRHHKEWHSDMKQMHGEIKKMTQNLESEMKKDSTSKKRVESILKGVEGKVRKNGQRAMTNVRTIIAEVIAEASPEERAEMADDLAETLDEWEDYKITPRRWWQFWR